MTEAETVPSGLWERMRADPQYAPEHLALEAVRRMGPSAHEWVRYVRNGQPNLTPEQIAEVAEKKFTNVAGISGAVSGAAGLPGAVADFGLVAWTQARMVLHIAAAYGVDAAHPDRALDLLVLQKVHSLAESARLALSVANGQESVTGAMQKASTGRPKAAVITELTVKLAKMAGLRAVKRIAAKVVPGASIILGSWANRSATRELATRARSHYRHIPMQRQALET